MSGSLHSGRVAPRTSRTTSTFGTQQASFFIGEALRTKLTRACVRPQACFSAACSSAAASRASRPHAPAAKSHPEACLQSIQRAVTSQVRLNSLHFHPRWHIKRRLTDRLPATGWTDQQGNNCSAYVAQGLCCAFPSCPAVCLMCCLSGRDRTGELRVLESPQPLTASAK